MLNLGELINNSGYDFYFLVVDNYLDINPYPALKNFHLIYAYQNGQIAQLKQSQTPYFCLEEQGYHLSEKNTGKLLSHPQVKDYIKLTSHLSGRKVAIIPFKPSAKIDFICHNENWLNICNPAPLNRYFEDKIKFVKLLDDNNLPFIPSLVDKFNESNFKKYQTILGNKLVIQTHFGWAGNSTLAASTFDQAAIKIPDGVIVKYSPYLSGYSLLNNCCLTRQGLIQSPPALQYTGLKPFTNNPFTTVGRQWPSLAPTNIQEEIYKLTSLFSEILAKHQYLGFFGLDFLVSHGKVYILECNPRLTASFAFYTDMELKNNLTPLFYFHLAEFLGLDYKFNFNQENTRFFNSNLIGSEVVKKDRDNNTVKKYHDFTLFTQTLHPINIKEEVFTHLGIKNVRHQKTTS